jgi:hypothetical protein
MSQELRRAACAAAIVALVGSTAGTTDAAPSASGTKACIAAHEEAQSLRGQKKLHAAHEKFVACARQECPSAVRKECAEQLSQLDKDAPTVALEARDDDGNDTTAVTVSLDGTPIADRLTGIAIDVDPGEHVFRFARADGKSIEQKILVVEGEKNRKVVGDFSTLVPKKPPPPPPPPQVVAPKKSLSPFVFVMGGVALVGAGSFAYFAATGKTKEHDLARTCSPHCTDSDVEPVKTKYLVADISLGVAVVATALAVVLALPSLGSDTESVQTAQKPWLPKVRLKAEAR